MRKLTVLASGLLLLALVAAWWLNARQPQPVALIPTLTGQAEYCLTCHSDLREISAAHSIKSFGCVICHGGERLALDATLAHSTMRGGANPSDPSVVQESCGGSNCHSGTAVENSNHIQRVLTSLQSTYAGAIAGIRYTYGAQPDLAARLGIHAVTDDQITTTTGLAALAAFDPSAETSPAIREFAQSCLTCHLAAQPRAGDAFARMTGCAACHSPSAVPVHAGGTGGGPGAPQAHELTTAIPFSQCDTCHNRGNYDLRTMSFVERTDQPVDRLHAYYQPIAQFTQCEYKLDCIDCHTRTEVMGDGDIHSSMKEIQYIQCQTCHGTPTQLPKTKTLTYPNDIAFRLAQLNQMVHLQVGDTILVTERGEPLWSTRVLPDGTYQLVGKVDGQVFSFRPVMGSGCTQKGVDQSSAYCHTCHSVQR